MTRFIFRQVDYRDLAFFLKDGEIRAKNHKFPQKCHQTSYADLVERRGSTEFTVVGDRVVNDYVPFYFSPITSFSFTISRGNVQVIAPDGADLGSSCQDDRIFFVARTENFKNSGLQYAFSSSALNTLAPYPSIETDLDKLESHINWRVFDESPKIAKIDEIGYNGICEWFHSTTGHRMYRSPERMAEFLVYDALPLNYIDCVIVKTDVMNQILKAIMDASDWDIPIYTKRGCYFG